MALVRVVLNRPESAANVGAVARVVANTGLSGLDLVAPCDFRTVEAWRMAWHAEDVLEGIRVFDSLEEALADAAYVAGLAGRPGTRVEPIGPREMAREIASLEEEATAAIVFGCESRGLSEQELCLCQRRVRIPAHPRQPSLNLAQAVMVASYEIFVESLEPGEAAKLPRERQGETERALETFKQALIRVGFLPTDNPEARFVEWRELFGRAGLTPRESRILLALGRRIANVSAIAERARSEGLGSDPDGT